MAMSSASEKLVDAAERLFYEQGISASGVDTIVIASGVSKPTLYAHFHTKTKLVAAVLERRHQRRRAALEAHLRARSAQPAADRLLSLVDWQRTQQSDGSPRGCPFVNAAVELVKPEDEGAREVVLRHKRWFRGVLARLAAESGVAEPDALASQLHLLIEGVNAIALVEHDLTVMVDAKDAARALLAAACHPGNPAHPTRP